MRVEKITFMQTFPTGQYANQKLGVEIILNEGAEDQGRIYETFDLAKKLVNDAFKAMNPDLIPTLHDANTGVPSTGEINLRAEKLGIAIENATTEDELWKLDTSEVTKYGLSKKFNDKIYELKNK